MRSDDQFPAGFGFDPGLAPGPAAFGRKPVPVSGGIVASDGRAGRHGGLAARFDAGAVAGYGNASPKVELGHSGFHLDAGIEELPSEPAPEPQSVVITTALVGILLATAGYFIDFG